MSLIQMGTLYPLSKERATELLKKGTIGGSTKEYLLHVLNDTREEYYYNRVQHFLGHSDFIAEGNYHDDYGVLVSLNESKTGSNTSLLARLGVIGSIKTLRYTIQAEELTNGEMDVIIHAFCNKEFNAARGGKGQYLTTKEEVAYIRTTLVTISALLQQKIDTKKTSR